MKLLIDGRTGFLKAITRKATGVVTQCALQFAAYPSAQFHSGAYLFMPDPHSTDPEHEVGHYFKLRINFRCGRCGKKVGSEN